MTYYIKQLRIENFKSLKDTMVPFNRLTVLAGANSVGKSTVIQSILLSRTVFDNKQDDSKIAINGNYVMQLGVTNQITDSRFIRFHYLFENVNEKTYNFHIKFEAKPNENYLIPFTIIEPLNTSLFTPNFHYLNAERVGPRPSYGTQISQLPTVGYQGEYTIELLANGILFDTPETKNFHKQTNTGGESPNRLSQQAELWMNFIIPDIEIDAKKIIEVNRTVGLFNNHTAPNVGFGISYVLPIVVSGLIAEEGSILIVENPEAHLHPYGQSKIGYFLAMVAASGVQVIVETHSEHVINGMRIASVNEIISNEQIQINFFSRKEPDTQPHIKTIEINKMGDLTKFPYGFFDQAIHDTTTIIKTRKNKKS